MIYATLTVFVSLASSSSSSLPPRTRVHFSCIVERYLTAVPVRTRNKDKVWISAFGSPRPGGKTTEVIIRAAAKLSLCKLGRPENVSRIPEHEANSPGEREERRKLQMKATVETSKLKSHVNRPGNCWICRTRGPRDHSAARTSRKRRQLGEIADNFEVPDEAYRRVAAALPRSIPELPFSESATITRTILLEQSTLSHPLLQRAFDV